MTAEHWHIRAQELYGEELRWQTKVLDEVRIRGHRKDVTKMSDGELALAAIQAKMDVDIADWERTQAATNLEIARTDVEIDNRSKGVRRRLEVKGEKEQER